MFYTQHSYILLEYHPCLPIRQLLQSQQTTTELSNLRTALLEIMDNLEVCRRLSLKQMRPTIPIDPVFSSTLNVRNIKERHTSSTDLTRETKQR